MNVDEQENSAGKWSVLACLVIAILWFAPLGIRDLFGTDEGRYAEIPREMVSSGDWITPRLNDIKYFEKPPLQYWTTAAAFVVLGEHDWTSRLWAACMGFFGLFITWFTGRIVYGNRAGILAAGVQASALLYVLLGQINTLDMGLTVSLQLTLSAMIVLARDSCTKSQERWFSLAFAVGVALALLSKGLIGILIPGVVACLVAILHGDWRFLLRLRPWVTAVVVLCVAGPWFLLVSRRNPEFPQFFFIHEHLERFLTREHHRYQPWWFFIPILTAGIFPWTSIAPVAFIRAVRASRTGERSTVVLLAWCVFILLFFSASQSKLMPYILPMIPAVALLIGRTLDEIGMPAMQRHFQFTAVLLLTVAIALPFARNLPAVAAMLGTTVRAEYYGVLTLAVATAALLGLGASGLLRRKAMLSGSFVMAIAGLALAQIASAGQQVLTAERSTADIAAAVRPGLRARTNIYCVEDYEQTLTFYLRRPCTLVAYRGELDFGLRQEPWRGIDTVAEFTARWRQDKDAVAIMQPPTYERLAREGLPMRLIYRGFSKVAVGKP